MSAFLSTLETIGADIKKGLEEAAKVVGEVIADGSVVLEDIAEVLQSLEAAGVQPSQISQALVQATATQSALRQHAVKTQSALRQYAVKTAAALTPGSIPA
jgi:hypothetical protein